MNRPRPVGVAAIVTALLGAAVLLPTAGGLVSLTGGLVLAAGVFRSRRAAVTAGGALQAFGALVAGLSGTGSVVLMLAVAATILAWDFGQYAVDLGDALAPHAATRDAELVRVAGGTLVAGLTIGVLSMLGGALAMPVVDPAITGLLLGGAVLIVAGLR